MKDARNQNNHQSKQGITNKPRPDVRDNLDHRDNLELNEEPTGHNKKEVRDGEKNEHNETRGKDRKD